MEEAACENVRATPKKKIQEKRAELTWETDQIWPAIRVQYVWLQHRVRKHLKISYHRSGLTWKTSATDHWIQLIGGISLPAMVFMLHSLLQPCVQLLQLLKIQDHPISGTLLLLPPCNWQKWQMKDNYYESVANVEMQQPQLLCYMFAWYKIQLRLLV